MHTESYLSEEEDSSSGSFNCNLLRGTFLKIIEFLFKLEPSNSIDKS